MTTTKSTRLTEEEVGFLNNLLPHFPEYRSESHLLHNATMLGLWMMAVSARRPGLPHYGGYEAADLVALLQPRILAALNFLGEQGQLPALLRNGWIASGPLDGAPAAHGQGKPAFSPEG